MDIFTTSFHLPKCALFLCESSYLAPRDCVEFKGKDRMRRYKMLDSELGVMKGYSLSSALMYSCIFIN